VKFQKILLAGFFSLFCTMSFAQYNTMSEWYIGPSAGASMSTINLMPKLVDKLYTQGKTFGFTTRYISENHFGFQIDLNYFEAGWKEDLSGLKKASEYSYARKLNFVEVPFLMHAYTGSETSRVFLNVGPKFSYLLSESENIRDLSINNQLRDHNKAVANPFQYGIVAGAGLEFHLMRSVLGLEGRYCYGLTNLFDDKIDSENFSSSSLQTISLNVYFLFELSGFNKKSHQPLKL